MIRINRLLRTAKFIQKLPARGGPGWDRPDVPPSQFVERDTRYTQDQIVYTFFDSSMPQFFLTQPQIYEGDLVQALPQLGSIWGVLIGTALSIFVFHQLVNKTRKHTVLANPSQAYAFLNQIKLINEQKATYKWAKQNPFGINVNSEQYPHENFGKYYYPERYQSILAAVNNMELINKQASQYLKAAIERTKHSHAAHH